MRIPARKRTPWRGFAHEGRPAPHQLHGVPCLLGLLLAEEIPECAWIVCLPTQDRRAVQLPNLL